MLVVSSINLTKDIQSMEPNEFLGSMTKEFTLNLNNDYRYLKTAYYVSMHAEILGNTVIPTTKDMIDANRTPVLLLKAQKAGIPTLPNLTTGSVQQILADMKFPLVIFPVNPFMYDGFRTAKNRSALYRSVKSLGMNYKFAVCVQPLVGEIISFKSIFGKSGLSVDLDAISRKVYGAFRIPICKLHVQRAGNKVFLCGLQSLRKEELLREDLAAISETVAEMSKTVALVG